MPEDNSNRAALYSACALGFAYAANYTNHAPMVGALRSEFGIGLGNAGLLTTAVFLTHGILQIPGGRLADRLGPTRVIAGGLAWVCAGSFGIAFAHAFWQLLFWKAFTGIGTGVCFAAGARYIVSCFEGPARHTAQGLFGGSVLLGSGFVIFGIPWILSAFGWRGAFLACTAIGLLVLIGWLIWAPRPEHPVASTGSLSDVVYSRQLWLLGLMQVATFGVVMVSGAWITTWLNSSFHLPLKTAGLLGSAVLLLGIVSRPLGGRAGRTAPTYRILRIALPVSLCACCVLGDGRSLPLAILAIAALGLSCGYPYAAIFNRAAALFPAHAGAAMGFVNMLGISMVLVGAPLVGYLVDFSGSFRIAFLPLTVIVLVALFATYRLEKMEKAS